ncbi:MAG: methylase [Halioglobus sp.]|nr:methylase [Halioglobus sp.]|tara:strand:+ start:1312 stop:1911 length:600 start_codon:yes stop_codon:yes gene_type:complete
MHELPFSQACENNKSHILAVLRAAFAGRGQVLEIGSGTGQHACHFAQQLPQLRWQPTDLPQNLPVLRPRCAAYPGDNLLPPLPLDVRDDPWSVPVPDAVFSANSLHIMSMDSVRCFFGGLAAGMRGDTTLAVYGPFNYGGRYTSDSNARFDQWLAQQHPDSAIRDFEAVDALAREAGFELQSDNEMPANNRLLLWRARG